MKKTVLFLFAAFVFAANAQEWVKTSAPDTIYYTGIRTWGNDTIYAWGRSATAIYPDKLVTSFDGGQTWTVGPWDRFFTQNQAVASPAGLHVGYYNYLVGPPVGNLRYTADGITWNTVAGSELTNGFYYKPLGLLTDGKLLLANSSNGKLNVSPDFVSLGTDYGTTFQYSDDFTYYAINPQSGRIIFGRESGEVHLKYTDDNALNFSDISLVSLVGNTYSPIVRYAKDNTFFNARWWGVNVSTDNGATWSACNNAAIGNSIADMEVNQFGRLIITRADQNVLISDDNGQSWNLMNDGLPMSIAVGQIGKTTDGKFWLPMISNQSSNGGIYYLDPETNSTMEKELTELEIYPNPVSDLLTIKTEGKYSYRITDVKGQNISLKTEGDQIDVSSLQAGIYFLRVEGQYSVRSLRFIKQ